MTQVVGNLITFSENQNQIVERIEICKEINSIIELIRFNGEAKNIQIDFNSDRQEYYSPITRGEFKQIILNLFKNAFDVLGGGGHIAISISSLDTSEKSTVLIQFEDNGPGIGFEDANDVFLPFKTSKNSSSNFGLGLSLCYNILTRNNGEIRVFSNSSSGCTFEISLPMVQM